MTKNSDLLWVQPAAVVSEATAIDPRLAEILRSRKFQDWKPSTKPPTPKRLRKSSATLTTSTDHDSDHEKVYTVAEVAAMWAISKDLVRDLFRDDPGVLKFERPATKFKRTFTMLRIPESAVNRIHTKLKDS